MNRSERESVSDEILLNKNIYKYDFIKIHEISIRYFIISIRIHSNIHLNILIEKYKRNNLDKHYINRKT